MDKGRRLRGWGPALAGVLMAAPAAQAAVTLEGAVTLDYYVAGVDADGFEYADAELYAERVANDSTSPSGPLSLSGWVTAQPDPAGPGEEVGYLPFGSVPGNSSTGPVTDVVPAADVAPGEYYAHVLLQDDDFPGTFEDARSLSPRLLWRGGLEAVGPLSVDPYYGGYEVYVDFTELRNNRLDSRYSNEIVLTLYATYGFGPASDGYVLCSRRVAGLYAGDGRLDPGFACAINGVPNGEYTLHLEVAEAGGRGGYSTLTGPDARFHDGRIDDGYCCGYAGGDVYVGATGPATLAGLLLAALLAAQARRRRAWLTICRIRAG